MPEIAQQLARVAVDPLTRREREIAVLLAEGMEVREIAESLGLSPKRSMSTGLIYLPS